LTPRKRKPWHRNEYETRWAPALGWALLRRNMGSGLQKGTVHQSVTIFYLNSAQPFQSVNLVGYCPCSTNRAESMISIVSINEDVRFR
jgi:hypothetical protein